MHSTAELRHESPQNRRSRMNAVCRRLALQTERRQRAECFGRIQSDAVQLALDLLVSEPDIEGFFRVFMKKLIDDSESISCSVWLLNDDGSHCDLWMAYIGEQLFTKDAPEWETLAIPRDSMQEHLLDYQPGWRETMEYTAADPRLPACVRGFNKARRIETLFVSPLVLSTRNLGWVTLSTGAAPAEWAHWRRALLEAVARQATLALHQSRLADQSREEARNQAVLEERNRIARDIHDGLAQGFAAILMQLQSARRAAKRSPAVASSIETAIDIARVHLVEARRSVSGLRSDHEDREDLRMSLDRMVELAQRTTDVPIELTVGELPPFGAGVVREITGIAQEALTNAVLHARARRIHLQASAVRSIGFRLSVADDGRGIAREREGVGFGLTGMHERADRIGASLTIVTAPRSGTEVVLAWEPASFSIPSLEHAS